MTKTLIALISILMMLIGYWFYFRDIFAGRTKPHAFSWLVWGVLTGVAFAAQLHDHGGPGSFVTGGTALISFIIVGLSLWRGEKNITRSDKLNLAGAVLALLLWPFTNSPVLSILLVSVIDFLGFLPTIRKSYAKPYEETLIHYVLAGLKFVLAIIALDSYTFVTWFYPASLVAANLYFAGMLVVRRRRVANLATV